ncbi:hypothetical protein NC652_011993 [Populus alba x Populus x berolinensis]|nr:hypothetical protein NC652_011993 [Populus alba x Populus x berolinensis]
MMEDLRERYFGPIFELFSHDKIFLAIIMIDEGSYAYVYAKVEEPISRDWALDDKEPFMQPEGGESVNDVAACFRIQYFRKLKLFSNG